MTARRTAAASQSDPAYTPEKAFTEQVAVEARALVEFELERVRASTGVALAETRKAALIGAVAVACSVLALGAVSTALMLAVGAGIVPTLVFAAIVLSIGAAASGYSYLVLPDSPVERVRALASSGFAEVRRQLKSHAPSEQRG